MKKNIEDYLITFPNFLDKDFCEKAIIDLDANPGHWEKHNFYNYFEDSLSARSGDNELDVLYSHYHENQINDIIIEKLHSAIGNYIQDLNFPWFTAWDGYTAVRFNRYSINNVMALHCDHIQSIFDGKKRGIPILSILGVLNDDFEGGELIFFEDKKIDTKTGDLLIFPSNFLYPHVVKPITKGTRYTYVSWIF